MTAVCGDNMVSEVNGYIKLVCPPFMWLSQAVSQITCLFSCGTLVGDLFCGAGSVVPHCAHRFEAATTCSSSATLPVGINMIKM